MSEALNNSGRRREYLRDVFRLGVGSQASRKGVCLTPVKTECDREVKEDEHQGVRFEGWRRDGKGAE